MEKNKIIIKLNKYDYLDYFLNRAYWHNLKTTNSLKKDSSASLKIFINFLKNQNIDFFLDESTFQAFHSKIFFNNERYYESIILKPADRKKLIENLNSIKSSEFFLITNKLRRMHLLKDKKIIKIFFSNIPFLLNLDSKNLNINKLQLTGYREASYWNKLYFYRRILFNKTYLINKILKFTKLKKEEKVVSSKKLTYSEFINICIEDKKSINWLLRKPHLDLVTDNKKYKKVKDILLYFQTPDVPHKIISKIIETDTTIKFEEPIHINKQFWMSGNNFYIYPLIFGFKKNVIEYKKVNKYIKNNPDLMLYSKKYFESLDDMNKKEIQELFENNPLEITNNAITSGRHRVFAMIGRLLQEKEYVPIYTEFIKKKYIFDKNSKL